MYDENEGLSIFDEKYNGTSLGGTVVSPKIKTITIGSKSANKAKSYVEKNKSVNKSAKVSNYEPSVNTVNKLATSIEVNGKKVAYQYEKEKKYEAKHPFKSLSKTVGGAAGTAAGAAIAGPSGAVAGHAAGRTIGSFVGNVVDDMNNKNDGKKKAKKESVDFSKIYRSKEYTQAISEYFDITDNNTRRILLAIDENDQNKVLVSLTSKLYDNIVNKVDDIDFGEIPMTKGDITKLSNYNTILECNDTMRKLLLEFKQSTEPVDTITTAIDNIRNSTDIWKRAFAGNIELPMVTYNTIVLAIIEATTYLISMVVEYIKIPSSDSFQVTIDKSALNKSKDHMIFDNLRKFNDAYRKGQITNAMNYIIKEKVNNFTGEIGAGAALFGVTALLFCIVPILRELIFLFYYSRVRISEYFEMQADMLQMNSYNVEHNRPDLDKEQRKSISTKQMKIADKMRQFSKKIAINMKESENKAVKEMTTEKKKYKVEDVVDEMPDSASSLF